MNPAEEPSPQQLNSAYPDVRKKRGTPYFFPIATLIFLVLVASIFLPRNGGRPEIVRINRCAANLKSIGIATLQYANENSGSFPDSLPKLILTEDITSYSFVCESSGDTDAPGETPEEMAQNLTQGGHLSYFYTASGMTTKAPATTVLAYELPSNHESGSNVLFADGHVEFIKLPQAAKLIAELQSGHNPPRAEMMK